MVGLLALHAPAFVSGFNDLAVVGHPIQQSLGHLLVAKDLGPFAETEVGCDDDRRSFGTRSKGARILFRLRWMHRISSGRNYGRWEK